MHCIAAAPSWLRAPFLDWIAWQRTDGCVGSRWLLHPMAAVFCCCCSHHPMAACCCCCCCCCCWFQDALRSAGGSYHAVSNLPHSSAGRLTPATLPPSYLHIDPCQ